MKRKTSKFLYMVSILALLALVPAKAVNFSFSSFLNQIIEYVGYEGDGSDGALSLPNLTYIGEEGWPSAPHVINDTRAALSATATKGSTSISIGAITSGSFASGDHVLIIQMTGDNAGEYEFGVVSSTGAGSITLSSGLQNEYASGGAGKSQVIKVPRYTNVLLDSGAVLTSAAWDGTTGGVLAFKASGTVEIHDGGGNNYARISMGKESFVGGPSDLSPKGFPLQDEAFDFGGVGGESHGKSITPGQPTRLIMGSGGDGADGGRGGGVIIVKTNNIYFGGRIAAAGSARTNVGSTGGAGGTILLSANTVAQTKTIGGAGSYASCGIIDYAGGSAPGGGESGRGFINYETALNCTPTGNPDSNTLTVRKFDAR